MYILTEWTPTAYVSSNSAKEKLCLTVIDPRVLSFDQLEPNCSCCKRNDRKKMFSTVIDPSMLCFDRLDTNWLCFANPTEKSRVRLRLTQACYVLTKRIEIKRWSITVETSVRVYFYRLDPICLCFNQLGQRKVVFDCDRPKSAKFRPNRPKLLLFRTKRPGKKCYRL